MSQHSRFLGSFCGFTAVYLVLIFLSNILVDPYGIWKNGGRTANDRLIKAIKVNQVRPKTIILGSSGVVWGLDTNSKALSKNKPVYNLGIFGANIYEVKRYFQHASLNNDLEKVVLGLDFYAFNRFRDVRSGFSESRLGVRYIDYRDLVNLYFSLDSLNLIFNPEKRGSYFLKTGVFPKKINRKNIHNIFQSELIEDLSEEDLYGSYELSFSGIEDFKELVDIAGGEGADIKTFIPPIHATLFYAFITSESWSLYEHWMHEIVGIQPVWDFSGCNSITTEAVSVNMRNYYDASHYSYDVGNLVLNRMFNYQLESVPTDFGVYVTSDNVEEHLHQVRNQCEDWESNNPEVVSWVENIKQQASLLKSNRRLNTGKTKPKG